MIQLVSGAEQIGLAVMLKDLIDQNLEQHPHKLADFKKLDIRIGLSVSDADIDLTLDFKAGDGMTIHAGIKGKPELCIDTDAEIIIALSNQRIKWGLPYCFDETGHEIIAAIKSGRLKIKGMIP
ncbi:MAG: SCP2 sterol-binding domain-containing protein, partial [Desulfobacterales bacterium]